VWLVFGSFPADSVIREVPGGEKPGGACIRRRLQMHLPSNHLSRRLQSFDRKDARVKNPSESARKGKLLIEKFCKRGGARCLFLFSISIGVFPVLVRVWG
jgi:hypothetical protein